MRARYDDVDSLFHSAEEAFLFSPTLPGKSTPETDRHSRVISLGGSPERSS
jgi:hypothetical protein